MLYRACILSETYWQKRGLCSNFTFEEENVRGYGKSTGSGIWPLTT